MTDGIIQEVFRKFNWEYQSNPRWNRKFNDEQMQELIENIKRYCKKQNNANFIVLYKLIGDNQE